MPALCEDRFSAVDRFFDCALLGMLLSGFFALASSGELDPITLGLTAAAFSARLALLIWHKRLVLPAAIVNAAVILYAGFYPLDYYWLSQDFLAATVRLICFLTVAKGLTVETNRDALYAILIAFAELLAAALLSASLLFFLFLSLFLFAGVATFASWQVRLGGVALAPHRFSRRLLSTTLTASAAIIVFTVGMFFILPRTARAALQNFVTTRYHLPGFSGSVKLGDIGTIQTSTRTMMHIKVDGPVPEVLPYKWRGNALAEFDGQRWNQRGGGTEFLRFQYGALRLPARSHLRRNGLRLRYQVQVSESGLDTLFVAGIPEFLEANIPSVLRLSSGALKTVGESPGLLRYSASSFLDAAEGDGSPSPSVEDRRILLALPPMDSRIPLLAAEITRNDKDDWRRARRIENWLRSNFAYTLELPSEQQADPIGHFLFTRKRGHCEYFASSMAVLLRTLGIPSRVVTGFQGGTRNPVSGWHVVSASDAHSWVEAWIPNNGWTTFDPTPANARPAGAPLFQKFAHLIDAADLFWQEWVMQYDLERQFKLAMQLDSARTTPRSSPKLTLQPALEELKKYGPAAFGLTLLIALIWVLTPWVRARHQERRRRARIQSGSASQSDAAIVYRRLLDLLEKQGVRKPGWYTPLEFARVLPPSETANLVARFTHAYNRFRFGADRAAGQQMLELYDAIERQVHHSATEPSS